MTNGTLTKKREPAVLWTLPSWWTTELISKKAKRETSTWTLRENKKNLWNMKLIMIPIKINALGTVSKGLVRGLKEREIR